MREDFKKYSWTLWLVIIAFLIGFSLTDVFAPRSLDETDLLIIDDITLTGNDFRKQLETSIENYKRQLKNNFNPAFLQQLQIPERILNEMINTTILQKEAKKMKLHVSDKEIEAKILSLPAFQRDGSFIGYDKYKTLLAYNRMSTTEFENSIKKEILVEKLRELITSPMVIDEDTLKQEFKAEKDKAELEYFLLKPERVKEKIKMSDNELIIYYNNNKAKYKSEEKRSGYAIAYNFNDFKNEINITDDELYKYYRDNKDQFKIPAKTKVSRIFLKYDKGNREAVLKKAEEISDGLNAVNFSKRAKQFSQDDKAKDGGDWGYWDWKSLSPEEVKMVNSLKQKDLSPPLDTQDGFSIILVSEKVQEIIEEFTKTKDRIKNIIERDQLNSLLKTKLDELSSKFKNPKDLKSGAEKLGIKPTEIKSLKNGEAIEGLDEAGSISQSLFDLEQDEIRYPVNYYKGLAIVQLKKIHPAEIEAFDKVKNKVRSNVEALKKFQKIGQEALKITNALNQIKDKKKQEDYIKKNNLKTEKTTYKRGNKLADLPFQKGLDDKIFSMKEEVFSAPLKFGTSVAIVKLTLKTVSGLIDFEHDKKTFYTQKLNSLKAGYFNSFLMNIRSGYDAAQKIRFNQKLFNEIKEKVIQKAN